MNIKLTKEALAVGGLSSSSSCQGFTTDVWSMLNEGKTVTVDSIPSRCRESDKIEEVAKVEKVVNTSPKSSSSKSSLKKGDK